MTALTEAIDAYRDAGTVWNHKIQWNFGLSKDLGHGGIIARYNLPLKEKDYLGRKEKEADPDLAMQLIWAVGAKKLAAARSLQ